MHLTWAYIKAITIQERIHLVAITSVEMQDRIIRLTLTSHCCFSFRLTIDFSSSLLHTLFPSFFPQLLPTSSNLNSTGVSYNTSHSPSSSPLSLPPFSLSRHHIFPSNFHRHRKNSKTKSIKWWRCVVHLRKLPILYACLHDVMILWYICEQIFCDLWHLEEQLYKSESAPL